VHAEHRRTKDPYRLRSKLAGQLVVKVFPDGTR
jgi:hypothetical protein